MHVVYEIITITSNNSNKTWHLVGIRSCQAHERADQRARESCFSLFLVTYRSLSLFIVIWNYIDGHCCCCCGNLRWVSCVRRVETFGEHLVSTKCSFSINASKHYFSRMSWLTDKHMWNHDMTPQQAWHSSTWYSTECEGMRPAFWLSRKLHFTCVSWIRSDMADLLVFKSKHSEETKCQFTSGVDCYNLG